VNAKRFFAGGFGKPSFPGGSYSRFSPQVTMDHTPLMGVFNSLAHDPRQIKYLPLGKTLLHDELVQLRPLDQFHGVVVDALMPPAVVNPGDIGMLKASGELHLSLEAKVSLF